MTFLYLNFQLSDNIENMNKRVVVKILMLSVMFICSGYSEDTTKGNTDAVQVLLHSIDDKVACKNGASGSSQLLLIGNMQLRAVRDKSELLAEYVGKSSEQLKLTSKNIHTEAVEIIKNDYILLIEGLKDIQKSAQTAETIIGTAYSIVAGEIEMEMELYNYCAEHLAKDAFRALSFVKFFYGRQVADGTLTDTETMTKPFKEADESLKKIATTAYSDTIAGLTEQDYQNAISAFNEVKSKLYLEGQMGGVEDREDEVKDRDKLYKMSARIRATLACGQASRAAQAIFTWTRAPKKLGDSSTKQLEEIQKILKGGIDLISTSCDAHINSPNLPPRPNALVLCSMWSTDLMYLSRACQPVSAENASKEGNEIELKEEKRSFLSSLFTSGEEKRRKFAAKYELLPFDRSLVIKETLIQAGEVNAEISKRLKSRLKDSERISSPINTSFFDQLFFSGEIFVLSVINSFGGLITEAYAVVERQLNMLVGKTKKGCLLESEFGGCEINTNELYDAWMFTDLEPEETEVAFLALAIGTEMQGKKSISKKADLVEKGISKYHDYMKRRQTIVERELSEKLYGDPELLTIYYALQSQHFRSRAIKELSQRGAGVSSMKISYSKPDTSSYFKKIAVLKKNSATTQTRRKKSTRQVSSRRKASRSDRAHLNQNYNMGEVFIHQSTDKSIFKIISQRYLKKMYR